MPNLNGFFTAYAENWAEWAPQLQRAIVVTIELTLCSFALAVGLGLLLALGKLSPLPWLRRLCTVYVEIVRGIPALAILFLLYFGLVPLGLVLNSFVAGFIGLGMSAGGYMAEILRAGIGSTHRGQRDAARAVGMTPFTSFVHIVVPQAARVVMPPLVNLLVTLLKDTSLCSLISTPELMLRSKDLAMMSFLPMHLFVLAALVYFVLAWPLSMLARRLQTRLSVGYRA